MLSRLSWFVKNVFFLIKEPHVAPSTFRVALSSLSIKPVIFSETDFVLQLSKTCQLICVTSL